MKRRIRTDDQKTLPMPRHPSVSVVQNPGHPISTEVLADAIIELSKIGKALRDSRLSPRAQVLLIHDLTGVSMGTIAEVLRALPLLEGKYVRNRSN